MATGPVLKTGDSRKRTGSSNLSHGVYQYRQICKLAKQAVCKTVAFGRCRFKSCSADYMPQSLSWWRSCLEDSRPVIPACRFKSCLRRYHIWRRVLTGRQPVPNTGDPKGFGGSNPPVFAYKPLWQNWQKHLPAKQGPVDPASGVGTRERRSSREQLIFLAFS